MIRNSQKPSQPSMIKAMFKLDESLGTDGTDGMACGDL
jgi:hypothetical protein